MGEVWRARHNVTRADCAIKILRPELARHDRLANLFVQEARVGARLNRHPNMVHMSDAGIDSASGIPFLVMELLDGETLDAWMSQHGAMPIGLFRPILAQLGNAVDAAHRAGVVHRDLKPENLFLTKDLKGEPLLKVLDFGIARVLEEGVERIATQTGTPVYAAPEQLGSLYRQAAREQGVFITADVSAATDVWALGLVAYELLTGADAGDFWGVSDVVDLPEKVVLLPAPIPSTRAGAASDRLPAGFDAWFRKCLDRDGRRRWATFAEATTQLAELIDHPKTRSDAEPKFLQPPQPRPTSIATPLPVTPSVTMPPGSDPPSLAVPDVAHSAGRHISRSRSVALAVGSSVCVALLLVAALVLSALPRHGNMIVTVVGPGRKPIDQLQVLVNGRGHCDASPCIVSDLAAGSAHRVRVVAPGYVPPFVGPVGVEPGKVTVLNIDLSPAPGSSGLKVSAAGTGLRLWLDGKEIGPLPQDIKDIIPGEHTIRVGGNDRYEDHAETVTVTGNEQMVIGPLMLRVRRGLATVEPGANAHGAKVFLVGGGEKRQLPVLPQPVEIETNQEHRLVAIRPGYEAFEQPIQFEPGNAQKSFVVTLAPKPKPTPRGPNRGAASAQARNGRGTINVVSIPKSDVLVDGRRYGKASRMLISVSPGVHMVVFVHPSYGKRQLAIPVESGRTSTARVGFP